MSSQAHPTSNTTSDSTLFSYQDLYSGYPSLDQIRYMAIQAEFAEINRHLAQIEHLCGPRSLSLPPRLDPCLFGQLPSSPDWSTWSCATLETPHTSSRDTHEPTVPRHLSFPNMRTISTESKCQAPSRQQNFGPNKSFCTPRLARLSDHFVVDPRYEGISLQILDPDSPTRRCLDDHTSLSSRPWIHRADTALALDLRLTVAQKQNNPHVMTTFFDYYNILTVPRTRSSRSHQSSPTATSYNSPCHSLDSHNVTSEADFDDVASPMLHLEVLAFTAQSTVPFTQVCQSCSLRKIQQWKKRNPQVHSTAEGTSTLHDQDLLWEIQNEPLTFSCPKDNGAIPLKSVYTGDRLQDVNDRYARVKFFVNCYSKKCFGDDVGFRFLFVIRDELERVVAVKEMERPVVIGRLPRASR